MDSLQEKTKDGPDAITVTELDLGKRVRVD